MRLLYHLTLLDIVIAGFNAWENKFKHPADLGSSDHLPVVTDFSHRHNSPTTTNVEGNQDRSNSLLHVDPINNHKRLRDSPYYLSSLPHSDLQHKKQAYEIASTHNAQFHPFFDEDGQSMITWIDPNPALWNDLLNDDYWTTASDELASKRDSNIAPNHHFDLHQTHISTEVEPHELHYNPPPLNFNDFQFLPLPCFQTSHSSQETASNLDNHSRFMSVPEASHLDNPGTNQVLPPNYYSTPASNELARSNPYITRTQTSSSDVAQESSKRDSNIAPNHHFDLHQTHMSTEVEPHELHYNPPPFDFNDFQSFPNFQTSHSSQETSDNLSRLMPLPQDSHLDNPGTNQVLQPNPPLGSASSELALLPPGMGPITEIQLRHSSRKHGQVKRKNAKHTGHILQELSQLPRERRNANLSKYLDLCQHQIHLIFTYVGRKYKLDLQADLKHNTHHLKCREILPAYLLYVEMINTISPGNKSASQEMKSAFQSYDSYAQYFKEPDTSIDDPAFSEYVRLKLQNFESNPKIYLLWSFLEVWLYEQRRSLFDHVKTGKNDRMILPTFKTYFNFHFIAHFGEFFKRMHEAYGDIPLPIHRGSDSESRLIFPEQEQSGLKFDKNAFALEAEPELYLKLLKTALTTVAKFESVLVINEDDIFELVGHFNTAKRRLMNQDENLKFFKNKDENILKAIRTSVIRRIWMQFDRVNQQTWLDYFDKTYNLESRNYHNLSPYKLIQIIFPLYLFFVEMINAIVPRTDLAKGGMRSAFNLFKFKLESYRPDSSKENNATHSKFTPEDMQSSTYDNSARFLWIFLKDWLQQERPTLLRKSSRGGQDIPLRFKPFFTDIFILSFHNLSDKVLKLTHHRKK